MSLITLLLPLIALLQPTPAPKLSAELLAGSASVQPGGQADLAIKITIEDGWHVYHAIKLDTGLPTTIAFTAPPGVTFDDLRFPTPYFAEEAGIRYLALSGTFHVLTTMHVAADVPAGPLDITAAISALACKELCVPVETTARLTLEVTAAPPAPANQELFELARAGIPKPLAEAPYLAGGTLAASKPALGVNDPAELTLTVRVKPGHHVQDRDPGVDGLIGSQLFIEQPPGIKLGEQVWPEPHIRDVQFVGKVRELSGEFKIRVPLTIIDAKFPAGPVTLRALFTYQACTDAGQCFAPTAAETTVTLTADTPGPPLAAGTSTSAYVPVVTHVAPAVASATPIGAGTLFWKLLAGFLGGLILNIMPCVFPVISIKIVGFVKQAGEDRARVLKLGLAFCAGIMVWFWIFGVLSGLGHVPLQHPWVVIGLIAVLFAFALNLFGVFEIVLPGAAADKLTAAAGREGYTGSFLKGFLATLLGTACTAPFFATAAAWAATQHRFVAFLVFSAAGLGMSAPYLLLSAFPGWLQRLPKPGPWMVTFKQAMGFILLGTAVWLLWVLGAQLDALGVVWTVGFLCFLAFAVWLIGRIQLNWDAGARLVMWVVALAVTAFGLWFSFVYMYDLRAAMDPTRQAQTMPHSPALTVDEIIAACAAADWNNHIPWQPYRPGLAGELAERGYTVYVDYTATWCATCLTNKASSVEIASTRDKMRALGVIPIKADYSKPNADIQADLLKWGRNTVPLNLVYPASRSAEAFELPTILTPGIVHAALDKAGPSRPAPRAGQAARLP